MTQGGGLVRDFSGKLIERCVISTQGWQNPRLGAMHFDETFIYETGRTDILNWTFHVDEEGRMTATEPTALGAVQSWVDGEDYRLRFRRRGEPPLPSIPVTYDVRFSVISPDTVLKVARLKLFGITLGVMTAFHQRLDSRAAQDAV